MSTIKVSKLQHPSASEPSIELAADGTVVLPLSGIGDLADVDEGSGAADGDVLTYDGVGNVWSPAGLALPSGIGSNVVQATLTTPFSSTSSTYTDVTGLTVTITPSSVSSKVLIIAQVSWGIENDGSSNDENINFRIAGGNVSYQGSSPGSRTPAVFGGGQPIQGVGSGFVWPGSMVYLDSPATTSATTYSVQIRRGFAWGTMHVNRSGTDVNSSKLSRGASSITAIEVAG